MKNLAKSLIVASFIVLGSIVLGSIVPGQAMTPVAMSSTSQVQLAQYGDLCGNWQRECARLYGGGTRAWRACMRQPQAIADCQGGNYGGGDYRGYPQSERDLCGNWQRQCARLYGRGSPNWQACLQQPNAIRDCGGRY